MNSPRFGGMIAGQIRVHIGPKNVALHYAASGGSAFPAQLGATHSTPLG